MNTYPTSDMNLAVSIISHGFTVKKINNDNPKRVVFYFTESNELERLIQKYWSKQLLIEPQHFSSNQKFLKSMIYQNYM